MSCYRERRNGNKMKDDPFKRCEREKRVMR